MKLKVYNTPKLRGKIDIPASKSHTIRAIVISTLAEGKSIIKNPLYSEDTKAAIGAASSLGAKIIQQEEKLEIEGVAGKPKIPKDTIDMANSGTSLRLFTSIAALADDWISFDGDLSLRNRPMKPLLDALSNLGAKVKSNNGKCPLSIKGPIKGGKTPIEAISSQFLSSILLVSSYAKEDVEIEVERLNEIPYVDMTLKWLDFQNIKYQNNNMKHFFIKSGQIYHIFEKKIPADWSSASFPICACATMDSDCIIGGLDTKDVQGDKKIVDILKDMGANIQKTDEGLNITSSNLFGRSIDLNMTPDLFSIMCIAGCKAEGITTLENVSHARIKETDRIKVMTEELKKMGADIKEREDGVVIRGKKIKGSKVCGHNDHRVVMALALAGLIAKGSTDISGAEAINVTYPSFVDSMRSIGAKININ